MTAEPNLKVGQFSNIRRFVTFGLLAFSIFTVGYWLLAMNLVAKAAQPPAIITYQGKLLNSSSQAVTTTVSMKIILHTDPTIDSAVYTAGGTTALPTAISVTPTNGIFTITIGDGSTTNAISPDIFKNNQSLYLEIKIGSDTLSPRRQITAAPYAYNSKYLDGVAATSTASSSTYIPISDSYGAFNFRHVTSTDIYVSGTSTLATTTFNGSVTVTKELIAQAIKDAMGWIPNQATQARLSTGLNNGGFGGGATPGNMTMTSSDFTVYNLVTNVNANAKGYIGPSFDGRYVYYAPWFNSGYIARYDTAGSFTATSSWTINNIASSVDSNATGFGSSIFDGRYVYFVPNITGFASTHVTVVRYDTTASFSDSNSWSLFNVLDNVDLNASSFTSAVFDGKYLYFVPGSGIGSIVRYNTSLEFTSVSSWDSYDSYTNLSANSFGGAVFDGRYIYFMPKNTSYDSSANVVRYDTTATFSLNSSWTVFNTAVNVNGSAEGFTGGSFDGRYVYFAPSLQTGGANNGTITRYDTSGSFSVTSSWKVFDVMTNVDGSSALFIGTVFDGRFVYFIPDNTKKLTRYDSTGPFTATSSWGVFEPTLLGSSVSGFAGAVFDGRYIYLSPYNNGSYHGNAVRLRAFSGGPDSTQSISKIARGSDLFLDSSSKVGLGTTNPTSLLTLFGSTAQGGGGSTSSTLGITIGNGTVTSTLNHQDGLVIASTTANPTGLFNISPSSGNTSVSGTIRIFGGNATGAIGIGLSASSATTTLTSYFTNSTIGNALVFDTNRTISSSTSALYSWRNNGQKLMSLSASGTLDVYGTISSMNANLGTPGVPGDLSERVDVLQSQYDEIVPGDVLTVSQTNSDTYEKTSGNTADPVMGVVATNPTLILGNGKTEYTKILTFLGRTNVKVSLKNGPIKKGDPLTNAQDEPGKAMKQTQPGPTIGTALEDFYGYDEQNHGQILALVRPGWFGGEVNSNQSIASAPSNISFGVASVLEALKQIGIEIMDGVVRVKDLVVATLETRIIQTKNLCVGTTCIDEDTLREMLIKNGLSNVATPAAVVASPDLVLTSTTTDMVNGADLNSSSTVQASSTTIAQ